MSPRFNTEKSMSHFENEYSSDSTADGTLASVDDLTNERGAKQSKQTIKLTPKQSRKLKKELCVVCNDVAAGTYFGATVCLPCKSFYIRCTKDDPNPTFACAFGNNCDINKQNRLRCQSCRFKKCLEAGMHRKEKLDYVEPSDGQELCLVCGDIANGCHFGIFTCEGCKKFYRRGMHEADTYTCKADKRCPITPRTRNDCRYCRFQKCLAVGMSRQAIKMGRPKKNQHNQQQQQQQQQQSRDACTKSEPVVLETKVQVAEANSNDRQQQDSNPECSSLVTDYFSDNLGPAQSLIALSGSEVPVCLPSLAEVKTDLSLTDSTSDALCSTVVCDRSSEQPAKVKYQQADPDSMFASANVDVDLDTFIRTLNEQEEAILSAQVEQITSTSGSEYGDIIHWLKDKNTPDPDSFFDASCWDQSTRGSPPQAQGSEIASPSGSGAQYVVDGIQLSGLDDRGRIQALKTVSGSVVFQEPTEGSYTTLTSLRSEPVGGGAPPGGVQNAEGIDFFLEQADGQPAARADERRISTTVTAPPSDVWLKHRSAASSSHVVSPGDESEMVSSTGQVKRRTLDSELSEVAPKIFRTDYWISQISVEIPQFNDDHQRLLSKLQTSYQALVEHADESKIPTQKNTLHAAEETINSLQSVTKRIFRSLSAAMNFALSIPGFKKVEQSDQFRLVKYGGFHMMIILAGREQYIPEKHAFKYFWNASVPSNHPAYRLRHDLLEAGKAIYWLKLDQVEAAALGALALISTDWMQLNFPNRLENINKPIVESFLAYVIDKHGRVIGRDRIEEMFTLMPTLRELSLRHACYMQNVQLVIDASELVKMCECISLDDCR